ncbi:DoxX family protein [Neisseria lisongii]|uniref:DoxX family protein n=1 Tax=Neisseria lisongii TaxID=2912188 RepID=A0AAW5ANB9_9NEIS|nr:DoxX family protein [Neisseria lisongii]MCF7528938.1 DoxX family protein [Neisseria lisongii]
MKPNASWQSGLGLLALRLFAAYEFFESGLEKWKGENWFADIHNQFPFPISLLPDSLNWQMAMFAELALPVLLVVGLAARLSALGLMIVTWVAWVSVHAGAGYNVCDNGYKMALIYLVVLFPILLQGAGGFSLDALVKKYVLKK